MNYLLTYFVFIALFSLSFQQQKTQLCADRSCTEKLFATNCVRNYNATHHGMLNCVEGQTIKILGIKLSSRPDFFYGEIEKQEEKVRGHIYVNFVDLEAYVFFLENAIENNEKLQIVQYDTDSKRMISLGEKNAVPELIKDYTVYVQKTPGHEFSSKVKSIIEMLDSEKDKTTRGHGHSHDHGHGNSHDHGHGNSHEHDNFHSTEQLKQNSIVNEKSDQIKQSESLKAEENEEENEQNELPLTGESSHEEIELKIPATLPVVDKLKTEAAQTSHEEIDSTKNSARLPVEDKLIIEEPVVLEVPDSVKTDGVKPLILKTTENKHQPEAFVDPIKAQDNTDTLKSENTPTITDKIIESTINSLPVHQVVADPIKNENTSNQISQTIPENSDFGTEKSDPTLHKQPEDKEVEFSAKKMAQNIPITNQLPLKENNPIEQLPPITSNNMDNLNENIQHFEKTENNFHEINPILMEKQPMNEDQNQQMQPPAETQLHELNTIQKPSSQKVESVTVEPIKLPDPRLLNPHSIIHRQQVKKDLDAQIDPPLSNLPESQLEQGKNVEIQPPLTTNQDLPKVEIVSQLPVEKLPNLVPPVPKVEIVSESAEEKLPNLVPPVPKVEIASEAAEEKLPNLVPPVPKVEIASEPPVEKLQNLVPPVQPAASVEQILTATQAPLNLPETTNELKNVETKETESPKIDNDAPQFDIHAPSKSGSENSNSVSMENAQHIKNEEFCHKENCQKYSQMNDLSLVGDDQNSTLLAVRSSVNQMVEPIRLLLPDPLNRFDTTGIFVFGFLLVSISIHLLNILLSNTSGNSDILDKKTLHDCITRIKEQDVLIGKYKANEIHIHHLQQTSKRVEHLEKERMNLENNYKKKEKDYLEMKNACDELNQLYNRLEVEFKQTMNELNRANELLAERENNFKSLEKELNKTTEHATSLSRKVNSLKSELENQRTENDRLRSELQDEKQVIKKLNMDLQVSNEQNLHQKTINEGLQNQVDELLAIVAELKCKQKDLDNSLDHDENGGSNGWSDLGDVEVDGTDNSTNGATDTIKDEEGAISDKTSESSKKEILEQAVEKKQVKEKEKSANSRKWSSENLFEVAKLKMEIRKLETERNNLKLSLNSEQQEKLSLTQRLEQIKQELADKRKEAEIRETNRHDLQAQCTKFLDMINEKDRKLEIMEGERERLREKISKMETNIRDLEDEKREISFKLKEFDQVVKKTEESNGKLENKLYHEERRLNNRIRQLEEQLTKAQSINNANNSAVLSDLNMSGNSSEREFSQRSEFPSLWSDIEGNDIPYVRSPYGETNRSLRQRTIQQPTSSNSSFDFRQPQVMSRSSPFELEEIFANKTNKERAGRPHRARSRSTGRQSAKLFSSIKNAQNYQKL